MLILNPSSNTVATGDHWCNVLIFWTFLPYPHKTNELALLQADVYDEVLKYFLLSFEVKDLYNYTLSVYAELCTPSIMIFLFI